MFDRALGWIPSTPDQRATLAHTSAARPSFRCRAPARIDPRNWLRIEDQGEMGSCSGHAMSTCLEYLNWVATRGDVVQLARMFCYLMAQRTDGLIGRDDGATISGAVDGAKRYGVCLESTFPYPAEYTTRIPPAAAAEATEHRIAKHRVLRSYRDCFEWLATGIGAIEIGISWAAELADNVSGVIDAARGQSYGGHAVAIVGYSDRTDRKGRRYLWLANSHGTGWGAAGWGEVCPDLFDAWGRDGFSEMIGVSDLDSFGGPREFDWLAEPLIA